MEDREFDLEGLDELDEDAELKPLEINKVYTAIDNECMKASSSVKVKIDEIFDFSSIKLPEEIKEWYSCEMLNRPWLFSVSDEISIYKGHDADELDYWFVPTNGNQWMSLGTGFIVDVDGSLEKEIVSVTENFKKGIVEDQYE